MFSGAESAAAASSLDDVVPLKAVLHVKQGGQQEPGAVTPDGVSSDLQQAQQAADLAAESGEVASALLVDGGPDELLLRQALDTFVLQAVMLAALALACMLHQGSLGLAAVVHAMLAVAARRVRAWLGHVGCMKQSACNSQLGPVCLEEGVVVELAPSLGPSLACGSGPCPCFSCAHEDALVDDGVRGLELGDEHLAGIAFVPFFSSTIFPVSLYPAIKVIIEFVSVSWLLYSQQCAYAAAAVIRLRVVLSGDVELNPGPITREEWQLFLRRVCGTRRSTQCIAEHRVGGG